LLQAASPRDAAEDGGLSTFKGFTDSESLTQFPDSFFHHLLNEIEDIAELKVTLYLLWRIENMEGGLDALCEPDLHPKDLGLSADEIMRGLEKAVQRGSILRAHNDAEMFYFLNSPRGRVAAEAFAKGQRIESTKILSAAPVHRPNIFKLYEENIGPLTPLIADTLKEAEELYPEDWIIDAIRIALANNVRRWVYISAILRDWKERGRDERKIRQGSDENFSKYTKGKYAEYFKR